MNDFKHKFKVNDILKHVRRTRSFVKVSKVLLNNYELTHLSKNTSSITMSQYFVEKNYALITPAEEILYV